MTDDTDQKAAPHENGTNKDEILTQLAGIRVGSVNGDHLWYGPENGHRAAFDDCEKPKDEDNCVIKVVKPEAYRELEAKLETFKWNVNSQREVNDRQWEKYQKREAELQAKVDVTEQRNRFARENIDLKEKLAIAIQVISERCCIDDCGFDVENESIETLRDCMKAIDIEAREALQKIGK